MNHLALCRLEIHRLIPTGSHLAEGAQKMGIEGSGAVESAYRVPQYRDNWPDFA